MENFADVTDTLKFDRKRDAGVDLPIASTSNDDVVINNENGANANFSNVANDDYLNDDDDVYWCHFLSSSLTVMRNKLECSCLVTSASSGPL